MTKMVYHVALKKIIYLFIYLFIYSFIYLFILGLHLRHMEIPRLGVQSER